MALDTRTHTARARREIINKHLYRDHGRLMAVEGESLDDRYAKHARLHQEGDCGHTHKDLNDLSDEYAHYISPKPLRIRTDRVPSKWTLTFHLAEQHGERIVGDALVKLMTHEQLHLNDPEGWAGLPGKVHRHPDLTEPGDDIEYKETSE